ncbi:Kinase, NEK [Giardia duodenalis]|uniref:non-specific serine/threonine protein kinase n=1 Tax=Giardia intestinalis (strain ATCC 50803 / WB clone C6) TaxID=184922 RepID=A8BWW5_GIAIC|nr:Kinase, NEK [Giardia intestinalis]KAE8301215.1 Kinase, NEK [Giardia intestinalis]|eukprot:XP_001704406.1 Kinase, NEK-like [Giardia lamblia ATCC 50803]
MTMLRSLPSGYRITEKISDGPYDTLYLGTNAKYKDLVVFRHIVLPEARRTRTELVHSQTTLVPALRHPHIIPQLQTEQAPNNDIITTTPYYENGSLQLLINVLKKDRKRVSKSCFFSYTYQLLTALSYLHCPRKDETYQGPTGTTISIKRVVHGAIRPASVLIDNNGKKVILGNMTHCQEITNSTLTVKLAATGVNVYYSSPEQVKGMPLSETTDIWSLGATLYEFFTLTPLTYLSQLESAGKLIMDSPDRKYPPNPDLSVITDKDVRFLLSVMLCMDPAERISAAELLTLDAFTPYFEAPDKQDLVEDGEHVISQSDFFMAYSKPLVTNDMLSGDTVIAQDEISNSCISVSTSVSTDCASTQLSHQSYMSGSTTSQSKPKKPDGSPSNLIPSSSTSSCYLYRPPKIVYKDICKCIANKDLESLTAMKDEANTLPAKYPTILYLAAEAGWVDGCREFIYQAGRHVRHTGRGYLNPTALMRAARKGVVGTTQLLAGIEKGLRDEYMGRTALMLAAEKNQTRTVEILINYEARLTDKHGNTALILATMNNSIESIKILCKKESNIENRARQVSLLIAAHKGNLEAIRLLAPYEAKNYASAALDKVSRAIFLSTETKSEIMNFLSQYIGYYRLQSKQ